MGGFWHAVGTYPQVGILLVRDTFTRSADTTPAGSPWPCRWARVWSIHAHPAAAPTHVHRRGRVRNVDTRGCPVLERRYGPRPQSHRRRHDPRPLSGPRRAGAAHRRLGDEAGRYAQGRLTGATVQLAFDIDLRDRYDRLLAYVYLGSELFNLTLVQQGYARADPVPPDTKMASLFAGAEAQARQAGRGVWSACPA
ncbi:MAG: thermonuclease family protein [Actinobacteria bacterium]|nr:MAG: thermonuclease family protein [Actinomycetota bacterium]